MAPKDIDLHAFDHVIGKITDGFIFEDFVQRLLCLVIGLEFVPLGGVKDGGLDGLDSTFYQKNSEATIYQFSIEADPRSKIFRSLNGLRKKSEQFGRFFYVTNRHVREQDRLIEEVYDKYGVQLACRDINWLQANIASSEATMRLYADFLRNNTHALPVHAPNLLVKDFASDPRVFVFLRQQLDSKDEDASLRELLVDSLILYGLEGTDPDKGILRTRAEIVEQIRKVIKFPIVQIEGLLSERLAYLSSRPRKINHRRKEDKYCLPYETRLKLDQQRASDAALYESFEASIQRRLKEKLEHHKVQVAKPDHLLFLTINQIYRKQGLDFADFILHQKDPKVVESTLPEVISSVLDDPGVSPSTRARVGLALQDTVRDIIYKGTVSELEYLQNYHE